MKELRAGLPLSVDDLQLIPVELTELTITEVGRGFAVVAAKEPVAVVVRTVARVWALDLEGAETPLRPLIQEVEGLREILATVHPSQRESRTDLDE